MTAAQRHSMKPLGSELTVTELKVQLDIPSVPATLKDAPLAPNVGQGLCSCHVNAHINGVTAMKMFKDLSQPLKNF